MSSKKKVFTAVLLPWLKLGNDLELGKYRFLVWPRDDEKLGEFAESIDSICGMYKYINGSVERPQTIMIDSSGELFARLDQEDRAGHQEAVILLTVALMEANQYFGPGHYINSSMTELHFQNFHPGENSVAFTSCRRDDSSSDMGYKFDDITISSPPGCRAFGSAGQISDDWLKTLGSVLKKGTSLDRLIVEASNLFCQANTDSPSVLTATEVVGLANAFDRLFPSANGRYKLAEQMWSVFETWTGINVGDSKRLKARKVDAPNINNINIESRGLVGFWMYELYLLRNAYVHGNDLAAHEWGWNTGEHLLMGAYIFPLLLKVLLASAGRYELSKEDTYKIRAVDHLLDLTRYYDKEKHINLWRKTLREVRH